MRKIIGYARVSTDEQASNSHALEQQIERLEQAGAQKVFFDVISGNKNDRTEFNKVLKLVDNNEVDEVIATRMDRLTRNEEGYILLKSLFKSSQVVLRLLDQGIVDLHTASGELTSDIQSIMAVHERRMLRERIKHGYQHRRNRNAPCGVSPFAYTVVLEKYQLDRTPIICLIAERPDNYLELSQERDLNRLSALSKADVARDIVETFLAVKNIRKAINALYAKYGLTPIKSQNSGRSQDLVIPRSTTHFREWIINPILRGHTAYLKYSENGSLKPEEEWDIRKNTHPQESLISSKEDEEIRDILGFNRKKHRFNDATSYLRGMVFCAHCAHKCVFKSGNNGKYKYYGCRYSKLGCFNHKNASFRDIEEVIIQTIFTRAHTLHQQGNSGLDYSNSSQLTELQSQLSALEAIPALESNFLLSNARDDLIRRIDCLQQSLHDSVFSNGTAHEIIRHPFAHNLTFWYSLTESERSQIYYKLIDKVLISHNSIISVSLNV